MLLQMDSECIFLAAVIHFLFVKHQTRTVKSDFLCVFVPVKKTILKFS